jgi:thiol protease/hemagglutinin prtT
MKKLSIVLLAMVLVLACVFAACEVDNSPKTYNVTFTTGDGYTFGGGRVVESGKDYTFTVKIADGYEKSAEFAVKANGKVLAEKDGKYTVSAVTENITVTVTGVVKKAAPIVKHSVTLPTGEGYTVTGATEVVEGENYTFTLAAATGFNIDNAVVKVNGEELDNNGNVGEYTVENVTADLVITVEGVARNSLEVTLTNGIGYKLDGELAATYGLPYTFEVVIGAAFKATDGFAVKVNGTALTAEEDGKYKVANPTEALTITVEGVTIDESKKASFFYAPKNDVDESYNANIVYDETADTFTAKSVKNTNAYDVAIDPDVVAWYKANGYKFLSMYYNNTNGNVSSLVLYNDATTARYLADKDEPEKAINGLVFAGRKYVSPGKSYLLLDLDNLYVGENGLYLCMRDGGEGQTVQFSDVKFSQTKPVEAEYISLFTFEAASVKSNIVGVDGGIAINMSGDQPVAIPKAQIDKWLAEGKNTLSFRVKIANEDGEFINNANLWCDYPNALIAAAAQDYVATEGKVVTIDLTDSQYANGMIFRADNINSTFYFTEIALTHTDYANVTLVEGTGYTLSGETRIVKGQVYTFKFALTEGYKQNANFAVKVNGEKVDVATDGTVTVAADKVTGDLTVTVEGVEQIVVGNTLTTGDGFEYEVLDGANATAIPYGGTLKFKVNLATGYNQSKFVVKDGEKVLEAVDGVYTITNIRETHIITVEGVALNTYGVALPTSTNYEVKGANTVTYGTDYSFTIAFAAGQDTSAVKVYAQIGNGEKVELAKSGDGYTVTNVTDALTITVEGLKIAKYTVTLTPTEGITYLSENNGTPATEAEHGSTYRFKATFDSAKYNGGTLVVKNGDTVLVADGNGVYSVENVSGNIVITVSGLAINTYTVTLTEGEGYTIAAADGSTSPVNYGGSFSFTVVVNSGYIAENLVVKANGTAIEAADGKYTVSNITSNITITVDGVEQDVFNERSLYKTSWYSGNAEAGDKKITVQSGTQIKAEWVQSALNAGYTHLRFDFKATGSGNVLICNAPDWSRFYRTPSAEGATVRIDLTEMVKDGEAVDINFNSNGSETSNFVLSNFALFKSTETTSWTKSSTRVYIANENGTYILDTQAAGNDATVLTTAEWWAKYANNAKANEASQRTILVYGRYLTAGQNTDGMLFGRHSAVEHVVGDTANTEFVYKTFNNTTYNDGDKFLMGLRKEGVYEFGISDYLSTNNDFGTFKYVSETSGSITVTLGEGGKLVYLPTQDMLAAGYTKIKVTASAYTGGQLWVGNDNWNDSSNKYIFGLDSGKTKELDLTAANFDSANPYLVIMASGGTIENVTITVSFQ